MAAYPPPPLPKPAGARAGHHGPFFVDSRPEYSPVSGRPAGGLGCSSSGWDPNRQPAKSSAAGILTELEGKGFLDAAEAAPAGRGRPPKAWKPTNRDGEDVNVLPPMEEMFPAGAANKSDKVSPAKPRQR
jgi:hypothetical protein